ncbi:MAG: hypothetical protein J2P57_06695 [Acidimicrobiaceae bacterium]|nr:hypothetical protein [Acidimicrobiaceae bacterium]
MADIDREVRERRAAGDLTPEFEHQLDAAFARVAPVGAVEGDLPILLDKIEASTTIDFLAPLPSQPVLRETRRVIRRAIRADLRHLGVQVGGLAQALARSLRCVAERLDAVEASVADVDQALLQISPQLTGRCALPQGPWKNVCADVFAHLKGRVLVAECGDGHLLGELGDAGVDAYGVDPDENIVLDVALRGLDVRTARPEQHLRLLDEASLAGIVLCGCVDRRTPDGQLALMDLSVSRLAPEGSLIVITHDPHSWSSARPMLSELSPGHPLTAASWKALFAARALRESSVHPGAEHPSDGAPGYAVSARR